MLEVLANSVSTFTAASNSADSAADSNSVDSVASNDGSFSSSSSKLPVAVFDRNETLRVVLVVLEEIENSLPSSSSFFLATTFSATSSSSSSSSSPDFFSPSSSTLSISTPPLSIEDSFLLPSSAVADALSPSTVFVF
jgi:hypothetical protein